jgi:hypothetical protein
METEKTYMEYLREKVPNYANMPNWEKRHVRKANKLDYNLYCLRIEGVI